jgi:hypothetical protein
MTARNCDEEWENMNFKKMSRAGGLPVRPASPEGLSCSSCGFIAAFSIEKMRRFVPSAKETAGLALRWHNSGNGYLFLGRLKIGWREARETPQRPQARPKCFNNEKPGVQNTPGF